MPFSLQDWAAFFFERASPHLRSIVPRAAAGRQRAPQPGYITRKSREVMLLPFLYSHKFVVFLYLVSLEKQHIFNKLSKIIIRNLITETIHANLLTPSNCIGFKKL